MFSRTNNGRETYFTRPCVYWKGSVYFACHTDLSKEGVNAYFLDRMPKKYRIITNPNIEIFKEFFHLRITEMTVRSDNILDLTPGGLDKQLRTLLIRHKTIQSGIPSQFCHVESYSNYLWKNCQYAILLRDIDEFREYVDWIMNTNSSTGIGVLLNDLTSDECKAGIRCYLAFGERRVSNDERRIQNVFSG